MNRSASQSVEAVRFGGTRVRGNEMEVRLGWRKDKRVVKEITGKLT